MRFCISCGYREIGFLNVNQDPVWTEKKEERQSLYNIERTLLETR